MRATRLSDFRHVCFRIFKTVSKPSNADKVTRLSGIILQLLSKIHDVVVHNAVRDRYSMSPHFFDEAVTAQESALRLNECFEHLELERSQYDRRLSFARRRFLKVHFN